MRRASSVQFSTQSFPPLHTVSLLAVTTTLLPRPETEDAPRGFQSSQDPKPGSGRGRRKDPTESPRPECGVTVASLPLSRTNRAIPQQPFGFELTVPACLDSNQASATDPRPPNSSRTRRWQRNAYTWGADHHADAPFLRSISSTGRSVLRKRAPTAGCRGSRSPQSNNEAPVENRPGLALLLERECCRQN